MIGSAATHKIKGVMIRKIANPINAFWLSDSASRSRLDCKIGYPSLSFREFEQVIMIAVGDRRDGWVGPSS